MNEFCLCSSNWQQIYLNMVQTHLFNLLTPPSLFLGVCLWLFLVRVGCTALLIFQKLLSALFLSFLQFISEQVVLLEHLREAEFYMCSYKA